MKIPETDSIAFRRSRNIRAEKQSTLHGSANRAADEAIEPVVVGLFGAGFPFVDRSTAAFGFDEVLGGDLFGEHAVLFGAITEDGKTSVVTHRDREACVREGLPPVRVVDDVADRSLAVDGWDPPVQSHAVAGPAFVFAEWV